MSAIRILSNSSWCKGPQGEDLSLDASRLNIMVSLMAKAEDWLGPCVGGWHFAGFAYYSQVNSALGPHIYYYDSDEHRRIGIWHSYNAHGYNGAFFVEIAHEVVHLISPVTKATVLEEGLATLFSEQEAKRAGWEPAREPEKYRSAKQLVVQLLERDNGIIKKIRKHESYISNIKPHHILVETKSIARELAETLCMKFDDFTPPAVSS